MMAQWRYFQHLLSAPMTLFFCALNPALWMCATLSSGRCSTAPCPCLLCLLQSSHRWLARAPITCSHFPHGNEHVITCVARLFFASWIHSAYLSWSKSPRTPCFLPPCVKLRHRVLGSLGLRCPSESVRRSINALCLRTGLTPPGAERNWLGFCPWADDNRWSSVASATNSMWP